MMSINEQIGMPIVGKGQSIYQPALYGNIGLDEITSLREPRAVVVGTAYWQNAQGIKEETADSWGLNSTWSGCNSCGSFSSADGNDKAKFDFCIGKCNLLYRSTDKRRKCTDECKQKYGITSVADYITADVPAGDAQKIKDSLPTAIGGNKQTPTTTSQNGKENLLTDPANISSMSNNTKMYLAVGGVAVLGLIIFLARRK